MYSFAKLSLAVGAPGVGCEATTAQGRRDVLVALARQGRWVTVYYDWWPNFPDEEITI
jgi:hypothetical protein